MSDNHGQVGEALYIKYTSDKLPFRVKGKTFEHGDVLSVDYLNSLSGMCTSVPIHIDDNTQGNYECVCQFGTEIW
jgi:hypothetical protein